VRRALPPVLVVTLFIVAVQLTVLSSLRFAGVVIMLVWLWPLAMGLTGNTSLALVTALVAGIFFDTHATTPFGLTALVGLVLAYAASRLGKEGVGDLDSAAWWVTPVLAALGGLAAPLLYIVLGTGALDFNLWRGSVLWMMIVNAAAFFVLARPTVRLARSLANVGEKVRR
jgi:cell shape-determining protein MreD